MSVGVDLCVKAFNLSPNQHLEPKYSQWLAEETLGN